MQEADERYHRNNTEVANAFMTKKNIPPKHQDYMKESRFLTVYRYIEVDEDCDLDKMQELEKNFLLLGIFWESIPMMLPFVSASLADTMLPAFIPRPTSAYALMSAPLAATSTNFCTCTITFMEC